MSSSFYAGSGQTPQNAEDIDSLKEQAETARDEAVTSKNQAAASASSASTSASSASQSASDAASSATSASTTYNNFRAIYLGSSASEPTVDGNGDALTAGDLYHDSTSGNLKYYTGSAWAVVQQTGPTGPQGPQGVQGVQGNTGDAGTAATISIGTVSTGAAGSSVTVTNSGTSSAAVLDFSIPVGDTGATGSQGPQGQAGSDGTGFTGGSYNASTGVVTFTSNDGLGFSTGDLRGATGEGSGDMVSTNNLSDLTNAATARTNLGVDAAGTDNSTNVTLSGTPDYLTLSGQQITLGQIDLTTDVTGTLPITNGGTGATSASAAATALGLGSTDTPSFGGIELGDNAKATFGDATGGDLQIYHNGSNSYIDDTGTGSLFIRSNEVRMNKYTGEYMLRAFADNAVQLYYDNALKLTTTSTGIDVTGTAVTDGVTVAGDLSVDGGTIKLDGNYPVGTNNVALGDTALDSMVSGSRNTTIGYAAGTALTNQNYNVFVGSYSGDGATGSSNVAVGDVTLRSSSGNYNVAVGGESLNQNTTASYNTAVGYQTLYTNTTGVVNDAFGYQALYANTTARDNVAIGSNSLWANTTGALNTAVGRQALNANTTGIRNTAVGYQAAYSNTTGNYNTSVGKQALYSNTTAHENVAVGYQAAYSNTTGTENTALGFGALLTNTQGNRMVAVGNGALKTYNYTSAANTYNVAVGFEAMQLATTSLQNTAVGANALRADTTGSYNAAFGVNALYYNTTGGYNASFGQNALFSNTTGQYNVANGHQSLYSNTTSSFNTTVGTVAGYSSTGGYNTFLGYGAGYHVSSGSKNTIVGLYNGNTDNLDIRTASSYTVLSDGNGHANLVIDNGGSVMFGDTRSASGSGANHNARFFIKGRGSDKYCWSCAGGGSSNFYAQRTTASGTGYLHYFLYNSSFVGGISTNGSSTTYSTSSDYRLKDNVTELTGAIDRVKQVPVHRFNFVSNPETTVDGFLAHEVQDIVPEAVTGTKDEVDADGNPVYQGIDQSKLVPLLTQALKEAITKIEALEARVSTLENA